MGDYRWGFDDEPVVDFVDDWDSLNWRGGAIGGAIILGFIAIVGILEWLC